MAFLALGLLSIIALTTSGYFFATNPGNNLKTTGARLHYRGVFVSFRRSRARQYPGVALVKIDGVYDKKQTPYFLGKKVVYVYKAKTKRRGSRYRTIWGKITKAHGNGGTVRAHFRKNLPASARHKNLRVMMYPSKEGDTKANQHMLVEDYNHTHFSVVRPAGGKLPNDFYQKYWLQFIDQ